MAVFGNPAKQELYGQLVDVLQTLFGKHPGFRAAHAKGIVCEGTFVPTPAAATISRAAHFQATVPATVRFSNSTGVPVIPDNDPNATPKGCAIQFHTAAGDTDIVSHSANGFPVSTAEDFLVFLRAVAASGPDAKHPTAVEQFVGSHPNTLKFVQLPKPCPASFARESYFALNAFRFINRDGKAQFGRYFIKPVAGVEHLDEAAAKTKTPDFLFDDIKHRIAAGPVQFKISLQLPNPGDATNDASNTWPDDRKQVEIGTLTLTSINADSDAAQKRMIFDPVRLIDGIELGDDPLPLDRSGVYAVSFARRNPS